MIRGRIRFDPACQPQHLAHNLAPKFQMRPHRRARELEYATGHRDPDLDHVIGWDVGGAGQHFRGGEHPGRPAMDWNGHRQRAEIDDDLERRQQRMKRVPFELDGQAPISRAEAVPAAVVCARLSDEDASRRKECRAVPAAIVKCAGEHHRQRIVGMLFLASAVGRIARADDVANAPPRARPEGLGRQRCTATLTPRRDRSGNAFGRP